MEVGGGPFLSDCVRPFHRHGHVHASVRFVHSLQDDCVDTPSVRSGTASDRNWPTFAGLAPAWRRTWLRARVRHVARTHLCIGILRPAKPMGALGGRRRGACRILHYCLLHALDDPSMKTPNQDTGASAGGPRQFQIPARLPALVVRFDHSP